jgi:hypothetical protein
VDPRIAVDHQDLRADQIAGRRRRSRAPEHLAQRRHCPGPKSMDFRENT